MFGQRNKSMKPRGLDTENPYPQSPEPSREEQIKKAMGSFGFKESSSSKKRKKEKENFENEKKIFESQKPGIESEAELAKKQLSKQNALESKQLREEARKEGRESTKQFFNQDIEGLSPEKRSALQYEANKGIQRGMQSTHRKLLGEQGRRGIAGRSGVGYAQQRDLMRDADSAKGQVHRDLDKLNSDLAMKKLAAIYAGGEGEAAQSQLDKQMALDQINLDEEKRRQREFENQMYKLFNRV